MLTKNQINFLDKVCYDPFTTDHRRWKEINGLINVVGSVSIAKMNLTEIPVQFGRVDGDFDCRENKLTTLKGAPKEVISFDCSSNELTNLIGAPEICNNNFYCNGNKLSYTQLLSVFRETTPKICYMDFLCRLNKLTSLEGCPRHIKGSLYCEVTPHLKYLWGIGSVEHEVYYDYNNKNVINKWIITCSNKGIIFPHFTLEENINWIKREQKYSCLLGAPDEIRKQFSPRILHLVDSGMYNNPVF